MTDILTVTGLNAYYGSTQALHQVNLNIADGAVTVLLGANGAGKTTMLRALCNVVVRATGTVLFQGQRIDGKSAEDIAAIGIAHVPDGRGTFSELSVEENLRIGAYLRKDKRAVATDMERMFSYFPRLKERRRQQAGTLSGGEQQMLAISRALMLRPKLILLDEPSFGVAPIVVREIYNLLGRIKREDRVAMLIVEQNVELALALADYAYLLETGHIVKAGTPDSIMNDEAVRRAYLGH